MKTKPAHHISKAINAVPEITLSSPVESYTAFIPDIARLQHDPLDESVERVIQRADKELHKAKRGGRKRIVIYGQDETGAT